jgi:Flp pilus assembly protein TadG
MKRKSFLHKKRMRAQSLVEFALVLPLLLLVVYGLLEVGRLIFTYSIVITASREAVRYGSATGLNVAGGTPRYKDCAGIMAAAQNVDFLGVIDDANITISYDKGPGGASLGGCPPPTVVTGDRISVLITAPFVPIITMPIGPITVQSSSARSIIVSLNVWGTVLPPTLIPLPPLITNTPAASPTAVNTVVPTNTPNGSETPTPTSTKTPPPTATFTPTNTPLPTNTSGPTNTSTATATNVNCTLVKHGVINKSGNTMYMNIGNSTGANLNISQLTVEWNSVSGHSTIGDRTLKLQSISLAGVPIWGGNALGPSWSTSFMQSAGISLPSVGGTIVFTFQQSYDTFNGTERITLQFYNNGCSSYTLDSSATSSCMVPGSTTLSKGTRSGNNLPLNWTASLEATGYEVYRSTNGTTFSLLTTVTAPTTTYTAAIGGTAGTVNYFKILPTNTCGDGSYSNTVTVTR